MYRKIRVSALLALSSLALLADDSTSIFSLDGMKGMELTYPDKSGREAVRISFSDARIESRRQCFYFKVNAFKTLVLDGLKIDIDAPDLRRFDAPELHCPVKINGLEFTLSCNGKKIRIVADFAKFEGRNTVKFPRRATLTCSGEKFEISEAHIKYENSDMEFKTPQKEIITLKSLL